MMRPTAPGQPRTMLGYYLGQLLCRVGIHKRIRTWEGVLMDPICLRAGCER